MERSLNNPRGDCGTWTGGGQERRIGSEAETEQKARGHSMQSTHTLLLIRMSLSAVQMVEIMAFKNS